MGRYVHNINCALRDTSSTPVIIYLMHPNINADCISSVYSCGYIYYACNASKQKWKEKNKNKNLKQTKFFLSSCTRFGFKIVVQNGRSARRQQMYSEHQVIFVINLTIMCDMDCLTYTRHYFPRWFSGALLPSHGLPPFGANITNIAMGEGLCGSSMFGGDRWGVGVNPMTAGT